jgi:hypothetical protein
MKFSQTKEYAFYAPFAVLGEGVDSHSFISVISMIRLSAEDGG